VLAVAAGIAGAYYIGGGSVFLTLLGAVILVVALWPVFTPTTYRLDDRGVTMRRPFRKDFRPWGRFRRFEAGRLNILLSPFPEASRLDPFRGMVLRLSNNRDAVEEFVAAHIGERSAGPDIWK
jgi:hypothetical protein